MLVLILPMLTRRAANQVVYRDSEGGRKRAEDVGKRGDIVGVGGGGSTKVSRSRCRRAPGPRAKNGRISVKN